MRPKEHRESGEHDLGQIIDMDHALVKLVGSIDWRFLEQRYFQYFCGEEFYYRSCLARLGCQISQHRLWSVFEPAR